MRHHKHRLRVFMWYNATLKSTHYWDCNGQGCDAATLSPWDESLYVSPPGYGPLDPTAHGGSSGEGEKLWMTGAASDALASLLGEDDTCCGTDTESTGCGKCVLVQNPNAVQSSWTAIVMKKNRCPPWSSGCETPKLHLDLAVPGYDNFEYSTANVCGNRSRTGSWEPQLADARHETHASYTLGDWYMRHESTDAAVSECATLPDDFRSGCELFSTWGWRRCRAYLSTISGDGWVCGSGVRGGEG